MTKQAAQKDPQTDVFHEDFALTARRVGQVFWGVLFLVVICLLTGVTDQAIIYFLGGLLAFFGFAAELFRKRVLRNAPVISIGPEGVSFPQKSIEAIAWDRVTQVRVREFYVRGTTITALDFRFRRGTLSRWQLGRLGVDRWEVITSIRTLLGTTAQINGGLESLITSVERFHPVER